MRFVQHIKSIRVESISATANGGNFIAIIKCEFLVQPLPNQSSIPEHGPLF